MKSAAGLAEHLVGAGGIDLSKEYSEAKSLLASGGHDVLRREVAGRLKGAGRLGTDRTLLIASVLRLAGAKEKALFDFFTRNCPVSINLKQFLFVESTLFPEGTPVPSDVKFDLTEYSYFDNALIFRKAFRLAENLKQNATPQVLMYLLLLFVRNDLSNENRMLVGLILNNIEPVMMTKVIPKKLLRDYTDFVEGMLRSSKVKNEIKLALRDNDSNNIAAFLESNFSFSRGDDGHGASPESKQSKDTRGARSSAPTASPRGARTNSRPLTSSRARRSRGPRNVRSESTPHRARSVRKQNPPPDYDGLLKAEEPAVAPSLKGDTRSGVPTAGVFLKRHKIATVAIVVVIGAGLFFAMRAVRRGEDTKAPPLPEVTSGDTGLVDNGSLFYTVRKGDTLSRISKRYYDDSAAYRKLAERNGIANPHLIFPDQLLEIPK